MSAWLADTETKKQIERVSRALMISEGKNTQPDDIVVFFDPFRWDGKLSTSAGAYDPATIQNSRPAWTAPKYIRMAVHAIAAVSISPTIPMTLVELEVLLNSEDDRKIKINSDGSITEVEDGAARSS